MNGPSEISIIFHAHHISHACPADFAKDNSAKAAVRKNLATGMNPVVEPQAVLRA
jgi:hypothetical protein